MSIKNLANVQGGSIFMKEFKRVTDGIFRNNLWNPRGTVLRQLQDKWGGIKDHQCMAQKLLDHWCDDDSIGLSEGGLWGLDEKLEDCN